MSVDKVEQLFQKALEMTRKAAGELCCDGAAAARLLETTFHALLQAEREGGRQ